MTFAKIILIAASSMLFTAGASAQALQMSTYLGAAGGGAAWNIDCAGTTTCNKTPLAMRVYGGYNFQPNMGVELTLASLGKTKLSAPGTAVDLAGTSFDVSAVYRFGAPTSPFGAFVKGGIGFTRTKSAATVAGVTGSATQSGAGLLLGVGATYALNETFALRAELDTQSVKAPGGTKGNVTSFVIGGQGSF
jgi:outer membrane protein W